MATQMGLKILFRRKNNNKVVSFSALFFMFTLTWTTEKELERVIENKGDEFLRKKNTEIQETKYWVSTYDNSFMKTMCN